MDRIKKIKVASLIVAILSVSLFFVILFSFLDDGSEDIYDQKFNVKFVNWDATVLYETKVLYGEDAIYKGPTPTKEGRGDVSYKFSHFTNVNKIDRDTICVAVFETIKPEIKIEPEYYTNVICDYEKYGNGYKIIEFDYVIKDDENIVENKKIVLPTMYDGLPVIAIGDKVFYNAFKYRTIEFPKYLEEIGEKAFYGNSFFDLEFPSTLKTIGKQAFAQNLNLGTISGHITLNEGLESIGDEAFSREIHLGKISITVTIPSSVKFMGEKVFQTCQDESIFNIYCKALSKPNEWNKEWHYNSDGGGMYDSGEPTYHNVYWGS